VLFDPILKEQGAARLTYGTPASFRIVFGVIALLIFLCVALVPDGPFLARFNAFSLVLIGLCLFAVLYVERWTFDRTANVFQRDIGILLLHARRRRPLDSLQKVVIRQRGADRSDRPSLLGKGPRGTAILLVVDREGHRYRLGMARGGAVKTVRVFAERLSAFCAIPLELPERAG